MRTAALVGRRLRIIAVAVALLATPACHPGPRPIAYGQDGCAYCLMQINDARYAAELVTHTGKVYTFDSIECLVSYYQALDGHHRDAVETMWVSDYAHPGTLISAATASYLRVSGPGSPMGRGMLAVARAADLAPLRERASGAPMTWTDVLALAEREQWDTHDPGHADAQTMDMTGATGAH
ncbi:MAG: nitrous oxide reductase accessory protein NosL [Gemmatimonadaceae bacterium]